MPFTPSRSLFIDLHVSIRGRGERKQIIRDWNVKNGQQKQDWLKALKDARQHVEAINRVEAMSGLETVRVAERAAIANGSEDPAEFNALFEQVKTARTSWIRRKRVLEQQAPRMAALRDVEAAQPRPNEAVIEQLGELAEMTESNAEVAYEEVIRLEDILEYPPVPPDQNGKRRLPAKWVDADRREYVKRSKLGTDGV